MTGEDREALGKFCVFCGLPPESKSREHIIPQWLIKLTGDPNRQVFLGRRWTSPGLEKRTFSLSSFTFPACERCNSDFSAFEARAHSIMLTILSRGSMAATDWDLFLDWLDKVRVGLWLGMIYLNENHRGLSPRFHIDQRIGSKDRLVVVYEIEEDGQIGIGWSGTETPLFEYVPSCFTLTVNNFLFLNVSFDFLISKRFGFPYPSVVEARSEKGDKITIEKGREKTALPLFDKAFIAGGTQLWQPMIPWRHLQSEDGSRADVLAYYENEFVKRNCLDFAAGRGLIFSTRGDNLAAYPLEPNKSWLPTQALPRAEIAHRSGIAAGDVLETLFRNHARAGVPEGDRLESDKAFQSALRLHRTIMNHVERAGMNR